MTAVLVFAFALIHQAVDLTYVRDAFHKSLTNDAACKSLHVYFSENPPAGAVAVGYFAANTAMHAQYIDGPYEKWKAVKASQENFAAAVNKAPSNPEIRYLRCLVELNLPSFLPINKHVDEDIKIVMNDLTGLHTALREKYFETARAFLLKVAPLSAAQKQTLRQWKP